MSLMGLAVGGAAANGAMSTFNYNRNAWMTDVQVNQARRYQRQNVRLSQAEMFREDIRDLVGSSVTKQNNYVLIATLVLGMIAECYIEGPLPDGSAEFIKSAYMLCLGSSLLYLVMSLMCAVRATILASSCQKDLLTTLVRLPVDEFVAEIDAAAGTESVEAFESQGISTVLRVPFINGLSSASSSQRAVMSEAQLANRAADAVERQERSARSVMAEVEQEESSRLHLDVFHERERVWDVLGRFAFVFGALGASHLLQAYGYFSAAKYYNGDDWASAIVQVLLILVDGIFARVAMKDLPVAAAICAWASMMGPVLCMLAIRVSHPVVDGIVIPLAFVCHTVVNLFGLFHLFDVLRTARQKPCGEKPGATTFDEAARPVSEGHDTDQDHSLWRRISESKREIVSEPQHPKGLNSERFFFMYLGNIIVAGAWFATACWAVHEAGRGRVDNGIVEPAARRLYPGDSGLPLLDTVAELDITWPNARFRPHAIACAGSGQCFVANNFLLFELLPPSAPGSAWSTAAVPCDVDGDILDVAAACTGGACRAHVLVRGPSGAVARRVCAAGDSSASAGDVLRRCAARIALGGDDASLFVAQDSRVVQYGLAAGGGRLRSTAQARWSPMWSVAELPGAAELAAIDIIAPGAAGPTTLTAIFADGTVQVRDVDSGRTCGSWALGGQLVHDHVLSGALRLPGSVLLLASASRADDARGPVRLMRAELPEVVEACGGSSPPLM